MGVEFCVDFKIIFQDCVWLLLIWYKVVVVMEEEVLEEGGERFEEFDDEFLVD